MYRREEERGKKKTERKIIRGLLQSQFLYVSHMIQITANTVLYC